MKKLLVFLGTISLLSSCDIEREQNVEFQYVGKLSNVEEIILVQTEENTYFLSSDSTIITSINNENFETLKKCQDVAVCTREIIWLIVLLGMGLGMIMEALISNIVNL